MLPHAPEVLAELLGGEKAARELLHEYFFVDEPSQKKDDTNQCGNLHSHSMGNEPAMHVPYLFSLFGYPEDTQNIVSIARIRQGAGEGEYIGKRPQRLKVPFLVVSAPTAVANDLF